MTELSVTNARARLGSVVRSSYNEDQITYLTMGGFRVAAIVPLAYAPVAPPSENLPQGIRRAEVFGEERSD